MKVVDSLTRLLCSNATPSNLRSYVHKYLYLHSAFFQHSFDTFCIAVVSLRLSPPLLINNLVPHPQPFCFSCVTKAYSVLSSRWRNLAMVYPSFQNFCPAADPPQPSQIPTHCGVSVHLSRQHIFSPQSSHSQHWPTSCKQSSTRKFTAGSL